MSDSSPDRGEGRNAQATRSLRRIAATLGVPETDFDAGSPAQAELDDACEMMRIWCSLKLMSDRRKLLAFGRALGEQG